MSSKRWQTSRKHTSGVLIENTKIHDLTTKRNIEASEKPYRGETGPSEAPQPTEYHNLSYDQQLSKIMRFPSFRRHREDVDVNYYLSMESRGFSLGNEELSEVLLNIKPENIENIKNIKKPIFIQNYQETDSNRHPTGSEDSRSSREDHRESSKLQESGLNYKNEFELHLKNFETQAQESSLSNHTDYKDGNSLIIWSKYEPESVSESNKSIFEKEEKIHLNSVENLLDCSVRSQVVQGNLYHFEDSFNEKEEAEKAENCPIFGEKIKKFKSNLDPKSRKKMHLGELEAQKKHLESIKRSIWALEDMRKNFEISEPRLIDGRSRSLSVPEKPSEGTSLAQSLVIHDKEFENLLALKSSKKHQQAKIMAVNSSLLTKKPAPEVRTGDTHQKTKKMTKEEKLENSFNKENLERGLTRKDKQQRPSRSSENFSGLCKDRKGLIINLQKKAKISKNHKQRSVQRLTSKLGSFEMGPLITKSKKKKIAQKKLKNTKTAKKAKNRENQHNSQDSRVSPKRLSKAFVNRLKVNLLTAQKTPNRVKRGLKHIERSAVATRGLHLQKSANYKKNYYLGRKVLAGTQRYTVHPKSLSKRPKKLAKKKRRALSPNLFQMKNLGEKRAADAKKDGLGAGEASLVSRDEKTQKIGFEGFEKDSKSEDADEECGENSSTDCALNKADEMHQTPQKLKNSPKRIPGRLSDRYSLSQDLSPTKAKQTSELTLLSSFKLKSPEKTTLKAIKAENGSNTSFPKSSSTRSKLFVDYGKRLKQGLGLDKWRILQGSGGLSGSDKHRAYNLDSILSQKGRLSGTSRLQRSGVIKRKNLKLTTTSGGRGCHSSKSGDGGTPNLNFCVSSRNKNLNMSLRHSKKAKKVRKGVASFINTRKNSPGSRAKEALKGKLKGSKSRIGESEKAWMAVGKNQLNKASFGGEVKVGMVGGGKRKKISILKDFLAGEQDLATRRVRGGKVGKGVGNGGFKGVEVETGRSLLKKTLKGIKAGQRVF